MKMGRRVVHITSVHPAYDNRIFNKECRVLAQAGFDVTLVAPNARTSEVDGIHVRGVPAGKSRMFRMFFEAWRAIRVGLAQRGIIYHIHDPELIPGALVLRLLGKMVVYDAHEDLPKQVMSKSWIPVRLRPGASHFAAALESLGAVVANLIVVAYEPIPRRFPAHRTILVRNFPAKEEFESTPADYYKRPMWAAYIGAVTKLRGAPEIVRAFSMLDGVPNARLKVAGVITPDLETELKDLDGVKRVDLLGWQTRSQVRLLLERSRVGLVVLHPTPSYLQAQPTKLFEYMLAGLPVVASKFPAWAQIVEDTGCGLVVDPRDPVAIAEAVRWLLTHPAEAQAMGERGRCAALERFTWASEGARLVRAYRRLLQ